jgi:hypothetical protein
MGNKTRAALLLWSLVSSGFAGAAEVGLRWDGASREHEAQLVESLRRITGLPDLSFGTDRMLSLGAAALPSSGSKAARKILGDVAYGPMLFILSDQTGSERVHFAEIDPGTVVTDDRRPGESVVEWQIRIDFADFARVSAAPDVRAAFDPGFALLHELLHGLGERDTSRPDESGGVEAVLNVARQELGLPTRERYVAERIPTAAGLLAARLRFRHPPTPARPGPAAYLAI